LDTLIGGRRNSELRLFDDYFVWEEERSAAVVKPHQIYMPVEIIERAQDARLLVEVVQPMLIPNRP
jgi:hypothetical protein